MSKKLDLGSDDEEPSLTINKNYATRYENWRRNEELQKLKDKYGNDAELSEGESESSESDVPEWTEGDEKTFFKALAALKTKDPAIYDKNIVFQSDSDDESQGQSLKPKKEKKSKTLLMKDYERNLILSRGGIVESDDDEVDISKKDPSYHEKLKQTKEEIKAAMAAISDDDSDDLLKKRTKTDEEQKKEEDNYKEWLGSQKPVKGKKAVIVNSIKKVWGKDDLPESEKFLRDYILEKKYDVSSDEEAVPTYDEIVNLDQAMEEEEKMEQFEQKFNYRFEDPDHEFIKQYPRTINDTLRKTNEKRKEQRDKYKERKEAEKMQRKEEISRMRSLKKKEIEDKLNKLKKICGKDDINFTIEDLEKDFDIGEYDKKMAELFNNDEVPEVEDGDEIEKPVFSDLSSDDESDYDNIDVTKKDESEDEEDEEDEEGNEDKPVRGRPEELKMSRRKRKRNTKFMEVINKKKPLFDPKEKTFEEYFNEYYALNYEDISKDGTINRFHYRTVPANDFGLSVDEILNSDDRALNSWVSIKKVSAYRSEREEKSDIFAYKHKAKNVQKKKHILSIDFGGKKSKKLKDQEEKVKHEVSELLKDNEVVNEEEVESTEVKKKTRRRKKGKSKNNEESSEKDNIETNMDESSEQPKVESNTEKCSDTEKVSKNKKPLRKRKKDEKPRDKTLNIDDDRLKAYGINPVKFHRTRIFGKKRKLNDDSKN